jgi:3-oxoacyl-[acyl-carrier protein] reductase
MDFGIAGRKAIVSAASKGLGKACAMSLAREGVDVTIMARTASDLEATADEIASATGVRVTPVAGDFNSSQDRERLLTACPEPDIVVNNPGVRQTPTPFDKIDEEEWLRWMNDHFLSSITFTQRAAVGMCERGFGRIVNLSVSFIKFPQSGFAHTHAARLALSGAVAAMARDLIGHNVTINTVCPGLFDTDALHTNLHAHAERGNTTYEAIVEDRKKNCPAGRFADPQECGDLVAFLCSAQAGFMTAQNIINDGGVYQGLF